MSIFLSRGSNEEGEINGEVTICVQTNCGGIVKPDIVIFGECLPEVSTAGKRRCSPVQICCWLSGQV
ncbi:uncharacterized protein BDW70DRAFT_143015 [Aspergillus foveolatus]|uniref:uncharacterized protein n=1 Tax=Aspergillus foveolatus TaxID=210207 RepID=UPI003CCD1097